MKIAVEGCCHGELDAIYSQISRLELQHNYKVDLLLICGDFQAIRNRADMQCMAVPDKYKQLKDFHKYYSGQKTAPILTIVIGGNHEASNHLWELYHGGWLAPNIYFLGHAGSVFVNGVRISGASGIYKEHDFESGSYEKLPYNASSVRSIYHIREFSIRRLSLLPSPDIFLSHDWPHQIEHYGNLAGLLARKQFLREDINAGRLGSPPLMGLLMTLRPKWWFAAHLHVRYEATVVHSTSFNGPGVTEERDQNTNTGVRNPDEIVIDDGDDDLPAQPPPVEPELLVDSNVEDETGRFFPPPDLPPIVICGTALTAIRNMDEIVLEDEELTVAPSAPPPPPPPSAVTKFLALDKCLPKRQFLEIISIESSQFPLLNPTARSSELAGQSETDAHSTIPKLCYDPEWLAITRAFHPYFSTTRSQVPFPPETTARGAVKAELQWVIENVPKKLGGWEVNSCQQFWRGAPVVGEEQKQENMQPPYYPNPQTEAFCSLLEIDSKITPTPG